MVVVDVDNDLVDNKQDVVAAVAVAVLSVFVVLLLLLEHFLFPVLES